MDFIVGAALVLRFWSWIIFSYDIACQWAINLVSRQHLLPKRIQIDFTNKKWKAVIPVFHQGAHVRPECQTYYSLHFARGVARSDGESIERDWSKLNGVAKSVKEMGPGASQDTLDDHFGGIIWRKYVRFGELDQL